MGNDKSKQNADRKSDTKEEETKPNADPPTPSQDSTTIVLLVHKSETKQQEKVVRNFRNALRDASGGNVKVGSGAMVNIADTNGNDLEDSLWLNGGNRAVLISLTQEAIPAMMQKIQGKGYVQDGRLNPKVLTVSFGASVEWPPDGVQHVDGQDLRDFAFNFTDVENLRSQDFETPVMKRLVSAIKGTN